jgi:hypothetical protein
MCEAVSRLIQIHGSSPACLEKDVIYSSSDLKLIQSILDDLLGDIIDQGRDADCDNIELKIRLATALFAASADGERDYGRLRQHALAAALASEPLGT